MAGCASAPTPGAVTPAERFRLAATLAAAQRCDTAVVVARAAQALAPADHRGALIVGACEERAGRYDAAIATYSDFTAQHPRAAGVAVVRARAHLALRASAERAARQALAREAELAQQPPPAATIAVLPVVVAGDSSYWPLSRGLAELITTDLAYVRTLQLLERLQIGVLLDELKLGASQRADPATAARVGRLLRAARMVQGTATIPAQGPVQLSASVVSTAAVVRPVAPVTGPFPQLLALEKQLVLVLATQLGIELTEAERQRILRQGPRNLAAFLAYSRGLEAMDRGDYVGAARYFRNAAAADPSFQAARDDWQAAEVAPALERAGTDPVQSVLAVAGGGSTAAIPSTGGLLAAATLDVVPTVGDAIAQVGGAGNASAGVATTVRRLAVEITGLPSIVSVTNGIIIIFKRP